MPQQATDFFNEPRFRIMLREEFGLVFYDHDTRSSTCAS